MSDVAVQRVRASERIQLEMPLLYDFKMLDIEPVFSAQYPYSRGRQLEGTFPGDRWTGIWVVTVMRIGHGWGYVQERFWPYDTSIWPPVEPVGLDSIAKDYRLNTYYRRVRTVMDCTPNHSWARWLVQRAELPVGISPVWGLTERFI
jgi:hypothetical protein